jgi:hypothetical protein
VIASGHRVCWSMLEVSSQPAGRVMIASEHRAEVSAVRRGLCAIAEACVRALGGRLHQRPHAPHTTGRSARAMAVVVSYKDAVLVSYKDALAHCDCAGPAFRFPSSRDCAGPAFRFPSWRVVLPATVLAHCDCAGPAFRFPSCFLRHSWRVVLPVSVGWTPQALARRWMACVVRGMQRLDALYVMLLDGCCCLALQGPPCILSRGRCGVSCHTRGVVYSASLRS